jgi:hypothetical protein
MPGWSRALELFEGVYLMYPGPDFQIPAEIRVFKALRRLARLLLYFLPRI